jgi:xanthosine utilization system XapX-like protein
MNSVRWLAVLPFLGILIGTAFFNTVEPLIFGIPFVLAWIVGWVVLTSVVMAIVYFFDPANAKVDAGDKGAAQ